MPAHAIGNVPRDPWIGRTTSDVKKERAVRLEHPDELERLAHPGEAITEVETNTRIVCGGVRTVRHSLIHRIVAWASGFTIAQRVPSRRLKPMDATKA